MHAVGGRMQRRLLPVSLRQTVWASGRAPRLRDRSLFVFANRTVAKMKGERQGPVLGGTGGGPRLTPFCASGGTALESTVTLMGVKRR